ncbi:Cholesterol 7-alpha-monooxygenase [Lambiella insularis]|nr:Cholesterol 7-alpha-monooxygenase [Lambiella insularis]
MENLSQFPYIAQLIAQKVTASPVFAILLVFASVCITMRLTSGRAGKRIDGDVRTAALLPHWIPYLGHAWWLAFAPKKLEYARSATGDGIFAISMGGIKHNMVVKPSLAKAIFHLKPTVADNHNLVNYLMVHFFGSPSSLHDPRNDEFVFKELHPVLNGLMKESYLAKAMPVLAAGIERNTPNLVSLDKSAAGLKVWELATKAKLMPGKTRCTEVSFFPLIRNFAANIAIPALIGTAFLEKYPNIAQDIWDFDSGIPFFMMQVKPWMPIPSYWRAIAARKRLRAAMVDLFTAMDRKAKGLEIDPSWKDLDGVSEVMWKRHKAWSKLGAELDVWAGGEMSILWASGYDVLYNHNDHKLTKTSMNVNANNMVFWLLLRIYSSPPALSSIRSEIAPFTISEDAQGALKLNIDALTKSCPRLKAAYFESLRIDVGTATMKTIFSDVTLTESASDAFGRPAQSYRIKKGEYIHVNHSLHQTDERYFPEPAVFKPERFLVHGETEGGEKTMTAQQGSIRPYGGGLNLCKGYKFAEREILLFVAGILATWDAEPVGGEWKLPGHVRGSGAYLPARDLRVRLSRRI